MSKDLISFLEASSHPRILVVGDVMLDRYLWGDVERISPEAPIPVLRVDRQEHRLGGAGSVAAMLVALETDVSMVTVVGDDAEGRITRELLCEIGVDVQSVIAVTERVTTVKERLMGRTHSKHPQQMIRVDREQNHSIAEERARELMVSIRELLEGVDLVLVSDYDKGVCAGQFVSRVAEAAGAVQVPVVADPTRGADYARYAGCTCITPNRTEAGLAVEMAIDKPEDGLEAARRILGFGVDSVVVTLDRDGIAWADRQGHSRLFPVRPRQVYDVTGAGDMVLSALGYGLAAGADWPIALELANLAGGLEIERLGVVPISRRELLSELTTGVDATQQKVVSAERLRPELRRRRARGEQIVMTNGCFDLLHPGHVASLQEARKQGDCLVVGLNSDQSVRRLKGAGRPIIDEQGRAEMLSALACVDYVVLVGEASVAGLVERLLPDVLVKAADYSVEEIEGRDVVESRGGRVVLVPVKHGYSTSGLIRRSGRSGPHHLPRPERESHATPSS